MQTLPINPFQKMIDDLGLHKYHSKDTIANYLHDSFFSKTLHEPCYSKYCKKDNMFNKDLSSSRFDILRQYGLNSYLKCITRGMHNIDQFKHDLYKDNCEILKKKDFYNKMKGHKQHSLEFAKCLKNASKIHFPPDVTKKDLPKSKIHELKTAFLYAHHEEFFQCLRHAKLIDYDNFFTYYKQK